MLAEVLAAVRALADEWYRAQALVALASQLPEAERSAVLAEALAAARAIDNEWFRARALVALAPQLPEALLAEALAAARAIDNEWSRARALVALAPQLPEALLAEALAAARAIDNEQYRTQALVALAPQLPGRKEWSAVLAEALAARAISAEWSRGIVGLLQRPPPIPSGEEAPPIPPGEVTGVSTADVHPRVLDVNLLVREFTPGEIITLTVAILLPQTVPRGSWQQAFDVNLQAGPVLVSIDARGFELISEPPGPIDLPKDRDTPPLAFQLRILEAHERWIHILVTQAGHAIAELAINDFSEFETKGAIHSHSKVRPIEEADLVLVIRSKDSHVEAYSPAGRASLFGVDLGELHYPSEESQALLHENLRSLYNPDADAGNTERELKLIGVELAKHLPKDLTGLLQRKDIQTVMLRHEDNCDFPLELCYLEDDQFVGDRIAICRWYLGVTCPPDVTEKVVRKVAILKGNTDASAVDEILLCEVFPNQTATFTRRSDVIDRVFKTDDFDLIHFTGHCKVDKVGHGGLELKDGSFLTLREIGQLKEERRFTWAQPFVMLNACASAAPYMALTNRTSFAYRFVTNRACAFVGTLWPVSGPAANDFARRLYARLHAGEAIGSALLSAKAELLDSDAARPEAEMPQLQKLARRVAVRSYCLFANPDLRLTCTLTKPLEPETCPKNAKS